MSIFFRLQREFDLAQDALFMLMHTLNFSPTSRRASFFARWGGSLPLIVNLGMVANAIITTSVGWSEDVASIARHFNIIELLFGTWFGGISLQGLSLVFYLMVFVLFGLLAYAFVGCHELGRTEIAVSPSIYSTIQVLSGFLIICVFPVTIRALVAPMMCGFWDDVFVTATPCSLSQWPQSFVTVVSLVFTILFCWWAFNYLVFGVTITPLSARSLAMYRGRSEAMFILLQAAVVIAPVLFPELTVSTYTLCITILMTVIVAYLIYEMPYFKTMMNYLRIFSFGCVWWFMFASSIMAHITEASEFDESDTKAHDIVAALLIPLGCIVGTICVVITKFRLVTLRRRTNLLLDTLRQRKAEHANKKQNRERSAAHKAKDDSEDEAEEEEDGVIVPVALAQDSTVEKGSARRHARGKYLSKAKMRAAAGSSYASRGDNNDLEDFFAEASGPGTDGVAFPDTYIFGMDAVVAAKTLLEGRRKDDLDDVEAIIMTSLIENPTHVALTWAATFLLFVQRDTQAAAVIIDETSNEAEATAPWDTLYTLYSARSEVARVVKQNSLSSIELRKEQEQATRLFLDAVKCLRRFWAAVGDKSEPHVLQGLIKSFTVAEAKASELFDSLEIRMPDQPSLLRNHAEFLECVLNELGPAHDLRQRALLLEDNAGDDVNDGRSSVASSTGARALHRQEWTQRILDEEQYNLKRVFTDVLRILICLVAVATLGLIVIDTILFSGSAEQNIQHIVDVGIIRYQVVRLCYYVRDLVWSANIEQTATDPAMVAAAAAHFAATQQKISDVASWVSGNVTAEYETATGDVSTYYKSTTVLVKFPESTSHWLLTGLSYFDAVSQLARRVVSIGEENKAVLATSAGRAASNTSPIWDMQFVMRNALTAILDAIEGTMLVLEGEVNSFVLRAQLGVAVNALLNGVLAIWIVLIVIRSLSESALFCRSITIVTGVALHLSKTSRRKLVQHYKGIETRLTQRGEEQNAEGFEELDGQSVASGFSKHSSQYSGGRASFSSGASSRRSSGSYRRRMTRGNSRLTSNMQQRDAISSLVRQHKESASLDSKNLKAHSKARKNDVQPVSAMDRFLQEASPAMNADASKSSPTGGSDFLLKSSPMNTTNPDADIPDLVVPPSKMDSADVAAADENKPTPGSSRRRKGRAIMIDSEPTSPTSPQGKKGLEPVTEKHSDRSDSTEIATADNDQEKKMPSDDDEEEDEMDETTNKWAARLQRQTSVQSSAVQAANEAEKAKAAELSPKGAIKPKIMFGQGEDLTMEISTNVIDKRLKETLAAGENDETTEARKHRMLMVQRLRTQVFLMVLSFVIYGAVSHEVIGNVKIGSPLFVDIVEMKDLIADLLPPPGYIIEAFLMALQLLGQTGVANSVEIEENIDELWFHEQVYFERNRFWKDALEAGELRDLMAVDARGAAIEFFDVVHKEFIPTVRSGDRVAATQVALKLEGHFLTHKAAIVKTVEGASDKFIEVEAQGNQATSFFTDIVLGVGLAFCLVFIFAGFLLTAAPAVRIKHMLLSKLNRVHVAKSSESQPNKRASDTYRAAAGVLFIAFILSMGVYCCAMYFAGYPSTVSGAKFNEMMLMKDLIADIVPPPAYLIESYLNSLRMSLKTKSTEGMTSALLPEYLADAEKLHEEYAERQGYWVSGLQQSILKEALTVDSFEPGSDFMALFYREFVPLFGATANETQAEALVYGNLLDTFLAHRAKVVFTVDLAIQQARVLQAQAAYTVPMTYIILFGSGGALLFVASFATWMLWYEGDKTESMRTAQMARDTTSGLFELIPALQAMLMRTGSFWMRRQTSYGVYAALLALSFSYVLLPMRHLAQIQNIASLSNQAGRSVMLASKCTHLVRELIVADSLMSMSTGTLTFAVQSCIKDMRNVHLGIRSGGEFGIAQGTDTNSASTDQLMFQLGCLRGDNSCIENEQPIFKHAASGGLSFMVMFTADLLEKLLNFENAPSGYAMYPALDGSSKPSPELAYVMNNFDGELFYGLRQSSSLLTQQFLDLFESIHFEQRVLYGTYVAFAIGVFFLGTFRYTVRTLTSELGEAKQFVSLIPLQVLPEAVEMSVKRMFLDVDDE